MDFTKLRVTQLPGNARIIAPAPLSGTGRDTELHLQHMKTRLLRVTALHLQQEYDAQGRPKESNLTLSEKRSLKTVKEMEESGVNVVRPADKANASVVDTVENYQTLMNAHVKDDQVLSEKRRGKMRQRVQRTCKLLEEDSKPVCWPSNPRCSRGQSYISNHQRPIHASSSNGWTGQNPQS